MASGQRGGTCATQFERLKKRKDFVAAASGRRFHTERMTVQGRVRDEEAGGDPARRDRSDIEEAGLRIGLTVTKRVGHAVARNRIKRRLREATKAAILATATKTATNRAAPADGPPATTCDDAADQIRADIVVIARRPALTAKFDDLVADFARALPKVAKPGRPSGGAGAGADQAGATHPRRGRARPASHSS